MQPQVTLKALFGVKANAVIINAQVKHTIQAAKIYFDLRRSR
jgi:hypothetical protein